MLPGKDAASISGCCIFLLLFAVTLTAPVWAEAQPVVENFAQRGVRLAWDRMPAVKYLPAEAAPFVEPGSHAIYVGTADLNGDSSPDYFMILENDEWPQSITCDGLWGQRPVLILLRQPDHSLKLTKRIGNMLYCSSGCPIEPKARWQFLRTEEYSLSPNSITLEEFIPSPARLKHPLIFSNGPKDGAGDFVFRNEVLETLH